MPRKPVTGVRLEPDLKRRIRERARTRGVTEPELIRLFISEGLGASDAQFEVFRASLDELRHQLDGVVRSNAHTDGVDSSRGDSIARLLERLLVQSTEILMMLRVVTFKDRPEDYEIAMRKTQETLTSRFERTPVPPKHVASKGANR